MAIVGGEEDAVPAWPRRVLAASGVLVAVFAVVAAARVPVADSSVWLEAGAVAVSAVVVVVAGWWLAGRSATTDRRMVLL